jgi:hypothetical protein
MNIEIKDKLYKDIESYCALNKLDFKDYVNDLLKKAFMEEKYGDRPFAKTVPYEKPLPVNKTPTPIEVEIEVNKNDETKEYEVEMKETTIPIETDTLKDAEELSKLKETIKSALAANQKPAEEITIDTVKQAIESVQDDEPVKEKPKRRKLK